MVDVLFTAVIAVIVLYFICRAATWITITLARKYAGLDVQIGSVGFGAFTNVKVRAQLNVVFTVEIEKIWLSSSYFNRNTRKLVGICVSGCRVQVDFPKYDGISSRKCDKKPCDSKERSSKKKSSLRALTTIVKWLSVHAEGVCVTLTGGQLRDCIIHTTIDEVLPHIDINLNQLGIFLVIQGCHLKILCSDSSKDVSPCVGEFEFSHSLHATVAFDDNAALTIKECTIELLKPHIRICTDLINHMKIWKKRKRSEKMSVPEKVEEDPVYSPIPEKLSINITEIAVHICDEQGGRELHLLGDILQFKSVHNYGPKYVYGHMELQIKELSAKSTRVNICSLHALHCSLKAAENTVEATTQVLNGFLGYQHDDLMYWLNLAQPLLIKSGSSVTRSQKKGRLKKVLSLVKDRQLKLSSHWKSLSAAVASDHCTGIKLGLAEARVTSVVFVSGDQINQWSENKFDLEMTSFYTKLTEGGVSSVELSPRQHHLGTIAYLGLLVVKVSQAGTTNAIDMITDNLQVELSTGGIHVLNCLISQISTSLSEMDSIESVPMESETVIVKDCKSDWSPSVSSRTISNLEYAEILRESQREDTLKCEMGAGEAGNFVMSVNVDVGRQPLKRHFEINSQCTNINVYISYEHKVCTVFRLDQIMTSHKDKELKVTFQGFKVVYLTKVLKCIPISRSSEIHNAMGRAKQWVINIDTQNKVIDIQMSEDILLDWTMELHLCILEMYRDLSELGDSINSFSKNRPSKPQTEKAPKSRWALKLTSTASTSITLNLQKDHSVTFKAPRMVFEKDVAKTMFELESLQICFDEYQIFQLQGIEVQSEHHSDKLRIERQSLSSLTLSSNRAWAINFQQFEVTFPFNYNFADCFDEVKLLNKWRKSVHKVQKKPFTSESTLPPDLVIKIKRVKIQVNDDPFEVKLGDNYKLACDEYMEHEKRIRTLDLRILELRKKHGLLPASKIEELYGALEASRAGQYIRRSHGMCATSPPRQALWRWTMDNLEITTFADPSYHGTENVLRHMREIDSESPPPSSDLEFVTLWCRTINVSSASFVFGLRDYSLPLISIDDLHVWGRLVGAEQRGSPKARRTCTITQHAPWGPITVERNMPALKFYHDFSCDIGQFDITYGGCWEPAMAQFNLSLNRINKASVDPSRPLPFWDKLRLLLHGRLTMSLQKMRWLYHASLCPYNRTEMMDWTWSNLILDWFDAKWVLRGDLDIYARTASKYDDCRLLHLPNLRFSIRLHWMTAGGNPNDHHTVEPCAPEKKSLTQDVDSYANFRSQYYNTEISFETKPKPNDLPGCLFYASTLRWMDNIKMCMGRVSRPVKRGKVFNHTGPRKPPLSRHVKEVTFAVSVHQFEVDYWASFARQSGTHAQGGPLSIVVGLHLSLRTLEDGLFHRALSDWSIREFNGLLKDITLWVWTGVPDKRHSKKIPLQGPVTKCYFLSVEKVSYQRTDTQSTDSTDTTLGPDIDTEQACHRVQVHNLKGAWTPTNRDVALELYDAYVKSQRIKKNLSSEALHTFKVENPHSPSKQNKSINTSGAKALFMLASPHPLPKQSDPALSMLQKLVSESDTKFVAANEEMPEPEMLVKQLHGIAVCDTEDVTKKNWHVELYNSQVVLRGIETTGYAIVSAGKASLLACDHKPVWQAQQLKSKYTLIGSVESMQYYATVETPAVDENIAWLSQNNIVESTDPNLLIGLEGMVGLADMVGSGQSVGGVVTDVVDGSTGSSQSTIQLQRIVSRCHCEFFYAGYGEVEDRTLPEVPLPPQDQESNMMRKEEGVDCFTLLHHDLNICTNSIQYDMILDIINNLLLHVESKKKELTEKLQNMRFSLQLASVEDQKTPILERQNLLREVLLRIRRHERELFNLHRCSEDQLNNENMVQMSQELQKNLEDCKEQVNSLSDELAIMISCFKESQLQITSRHKAALIQKEAPVTRLYEVCFKHAEWRMTEDDGQIGIADHVLKNFLYTKTNCEDGSGSHQLDLGWVKVTNLQPGTPYRESLVPRDPLGKGLPDRVQLLRILCKFKAPVGGISVKEHFEVNVAPLTIQLTARFFRTIMSYFFRDKQEPEEIEDEEEKLPPGSENHPTVAPTVRAKRKEDKQVVGTDSSKNHHTRGFISFVRDIDKMKERAAKNNMFLYIKIPEVPLRVSYKGDKEKHITNINDFQFLLPTLEYHDQTMTWHDLALVLKNDSKKRLIAQAVQQKLNIKMHLFDFLQDQVHEDADKARMLLGTKLPPGAGEKKGSKKSLFGSKHKS